MTQISAVSSGKVLKPARELIPATLPDLAYTPEVARETAHLYERVSRVIPPIEWPGFAPYIKAINELKRSRNAVMLAHNYMTPDIFHCVADVVGDCLSSPARRRRPTPRSSCRPACISWPRPRSC